MMQEPTAAPSEPHGPSTTHVVHVLMQFALAVRYRKNVVILALVISGILGALYYATATRYYSARASLLVMQNGNEIMNPTLAAQGGNQESLLPTYETVITSARVLQAALERLPQESRIDLAGAPKEQWVAILQENLSARTIRNTKVLEIDYCSKDPDAAVDVVNVVVQSYLDFINKNRQLTAAEIIEVLTRQRAELAQTLAAKQQELLTCLDQVRSLGAASDEKVVHPLVQRALAFNEELTLTQKKRVEIEASLAALRVAMQNGGDLQQHLLTVSDLVGKEVLLTALGLSSLDATSVATLERDLMNDRAKLLGLQNHYGPRHPSVVALADRIQLTEQYLRGYQDRVAQRLAEFQNGRLGPTLESMLQQGLVKLQQTELALEQEYSRALTAASGFNRELNRIKILEHDIEWLRSQHDVFMKQITALNLKEQGPEVRTAIITAPEKMSAPVSPSLKRVAALAILAGLTAGLIAVYVLDTLDDRFRSVEEMQQQLGAPVLAMVRPLTTKEGGGAQSLQVHRFPDASESEAFRTLRTAMSLAEGQTNRLVVTSTEPGDGKTTLLANLAVSFAQADKRTLLIDADLRRPGMTTLLGLRGIEGLSSVIRSSGDVVETAAAHIRASGVEGLDVLPSGTRPSDPAELLAHPRFAELLAWAESVYDQVLVDSPPVLAAGDTAIVGRLCDGVVLVVQPHKNRRRLVLRAVDTLVSLKIPVLGIVINRVGASGEEQYYGYGEGYAYDYHYGPDDERRTPASLSAHEHYSLVDPGSEPEDAAGHPMIVPRRVA